ncbi:Centrosome-associated protein 350 [Chionoecetes opilio]|uniref:Centrosome-associated protein 350 n=1 Tax=Chionoecetes opilio TaxID=41210 RepID=A0A8J5CZG9_CHIOP|nr:Centrosome-associated protein 350 [Chionoecetes opilio]
MTSHRHAPPNPRPIGQADLDFQPVREARVRVLNNIPKEPCVPPHPPLVKFNFVDVSFPKPPQRESEATQGHQGNVTHGSKKRSNAPRKERSTRNQVRYDKENSYDSPAQRNMARDRGEYLTRLLRRGVPVWEEVPEEERAAKVIDTIGAAWEDVEDGFKNSCPLDHADDLIDSPRGSASEAEKKCLKSKAERLNNILRKNNHIASNAARDTPLYNRAENLSGHEDHEGGQIMPSDVHRKVFKPGLRPTTLTRELHTGEATEAAPSTRQGQIPEHSKDSSSSQGLLHQDLPENVGCQEMVPPVPGGRLPHTDENTHHDEDLDQERTLRTAMKKINARQIDNNEVEEVVNSPLRMRHYEVDEVRKYMRGKQSERAKGLKEQQRRQEQEKVQRNERMKELAIKTKQLSQAGKKGSCDAMADAFLNQDQDQLDQQPLIDWGGHGAWGPEAEAHPGPSSANHVNTQLKDQSLSPGASRMPSSTRAGKSPKKSETKMDISKADVLQNSALNEEKRHGEVNAKKRSKKDSKKRRKRRSASDSEAISDIVSRTVEECERQVKASSVSMESLSSFSSFSCSSSDAESRSSQSESLSSGLDLAPTERAVALGQLAKKLTNQVTQETNHLTQQEKQSLDVANTPHKAARTSVEKQATKRVRDKSPNTKSDPRASLSFSQIEKMSVDELIAKMTAMLPNKTLNEGWSNAPHADLGLKRNAYENQKFDFSTHNQSRSENATDKHIQDIPVKENLQTMLTEQLPKLVVPNIPNLELSCGDKRPKDPNEIAPRENLSTLPGRTIVPGVKDGRTIVPGVKDGRTIVPGVKDGRTIVPGVKDLKSQTDEEKQVYVKMTSSHKVRHKYVVSHSENHLSGRQPGQSQGVYNVSNKDLNTSCEKFEYAATVIQAAYRGFRVRKITSLLVNRQPARKRKDTNEIRSLRRAPTGAPASVEPRSYRFFRDSDTVIEGNGDQRQEMLSKEAREQVNWREIQSELESRTLRPRKESYYISQTSDLPGWIKPYFVLSETGDVRNFLETQADKPDSVAGEEAEYESRSSKPHSPTQKTSIKDLKKHHMKEPLPSKKIHGSSLMSSLSKSREKEKKKEEKDTSDAYSDSFEVDSENENSNTLSSEFQGRSQGAYGGDLALVVSSGNLFNDMGYRSSAHSVGGGATSVHGSGGDSALGVTLSVVESLLKEEEVHQQHQKALLKLQEQSLIEEAKWKLAALQSEGGPGVRRRQRVVLQLREQKAYLKRLRETQNIGAQHSKLMLLQLHHLLGTTTSMPGFSTKGYLTTPRGHSPNPSSPRLTPRLMEMHSSSSSDAPEDVHLNVPMRGRDKESSSPSESGGGREKRRSHSDDRQKLGSGRLHEKRRTAEAETLQQLLLYDDKEGRLKTKSPYDAHDKDSVKPKRKGDFITKRSREKKEKSSGSVSPHSFHKQGSRTSTESSVPTESVVATTHDSQSSIPEEVGSETISRSDVTSSVSEQEGLTVTSHRTGSSQAKDVSSGSKKLASCVVSEKEASHSLTPKPKMITSDSETIQEAPYIHSDKDSKNNEKSSSVKTASNGEISVSEERFGYDRSERNSRPSEKSSTANSEVSEKISISQESSIRTKYSSESIKSRRNKSEPLIPEDITENSNVRTTPNSSWFSTETGGARSSDSKSVEGKSLSQNSSTRGLPLPLKVPLSPRSPHRQHRRYSSESDDSFTLSQTETASDMSDGEGRLLALKEELATRRAEADRLKKEKRRMRRERLASQERALRQQISTYDAYIQHARMELEKESKELKQASMVRPLIKKPQVAETKKSRLSESLATSPEKSDISDVSLVSEGTKSDYSGLSKSLDMNLKEIHHGKPHEVVKSKELTTKHIGAGSSKEPITSPCLSEVETNEQSSSSKKETTETSESQRENESEKTSLASSVSENLNEESVSEHTDDDVSSKKSISQGSSVGTDPTPSQASSTQTIVHSPQKLDLSQKDVAVISMNEVSAALLEVLKDNVSISKAGESDPVIIAESEKKLEIFIPTSGLKSSEAEDLVEGSTNTSAEQSMGEEVCEDFFEEVESEGVSQETEASKSGLVPLTLIEVEAHEKIDTSHSSSLSETEPLTDIETPTIHSPEIKKTPENASKKRSPTPDRQRLVDDISNNILAVMMKDTSLLFTNIMKNKVNVSKVSVEEDYDETVRDSTAPEPSGEASEPQEDAGSQSQHSRLLVRDDEFSIAEPSSGSKSQIVQRVDELIGESGSGSPRLSSIGSPSSRDVQLSPHMTVDLNPESSSPVPLTTENTSEVERGVEELCQGAASLVAGEITSPGKEEEHSSLSPSHDIVKAEEYKLDTETLTNRLLNLASAPEVDLEAWLGHVGESNEFSVEGIEGNWVDDNFWTSSDNKKKQQQLKAEEERITAEIARLEELQHLQQKYPGLVIREVPNKPPPPYTPPQVTSPPSPASSLTPARPPAYSSPPTSPVLLEAQPPSPTHSVSVSHRLSKADQRRLAAHVTQLVPITEEEALPIIDSALDVLSEAWQNNIDPGDISPPPHTTLADVFSLSSFSEEDMHEDEKTSTRAFHLLLFCLGRELLSVPYKLLHAALPPPWMKQALPQGCIRGRGLTQSQGKLSSMVREQVKVLFGWKPPLQKESLMIRWAQKHRDLVDQVLVKELQAEEASWTNYDEDEAAVKTKVASDILDTLVSETVTLMSSILFRKLGYIAH